MKRFWGILCAASLLLGLAACGGDEPVSSEPAGDSLPVSIQHPPCRADGECGISSAA